MTDNIKWKKSDRLKWILTDYGSKRINQLLTNTSEKIRISYMDIGDGYGDNEPDPSSRQGDIDGIGGGLLHKVAEKIKITEKGIATDRENTVYFKAVIDENMCGYDITELAIYEEAPDGTYKMFAVGVGQGIAKPDIKYGYVMSIEYTLFIESTNLLDVYDRIELDPNNDYLKESDISSLYRSVLYVEGNLAEQINRNSHIIGLGRAQELNDLISNTLLKYNSAAISTYFSSMANSINNLENLIGFWSFHYTNNYGVSRNIKDFSTYSNYLSTNALLSSYTQEYLGVLSSLNFSGEDYFRCDEVPSAIVYSDNITVGQVKNHEIDGDFYYMPEDDTWRYHAVKYSQSDMRRSIIPYYLKADTARVLSGRIVLVTTTEGKIKFGTSCFAPVTWEFQNNLWSSKEINETMTETMFKNKIVDYEGNPTNGTKIKTSTFANNITLYLADPDTPDPIIIDTTTSTRTETQINEETGEEREVEVPYSEPLIGNNCEAPLSWIFKSTASGSRWECRENSSLQYSEEVFKSTVVSYTGTPVAGDIIEANTLLNMNEKITLTGKHFDLIQYVNDNVVDSPFTFIASLKHNEMGHTNTLLAQSSDFGTDKHNFEIVKNDQDGIEVTLYSGSKDKYVKFRTNDKIVPSTIYNLVISYNPNYTASYGSFDPSLKVYINNIAYDTIRTLNYYTGMKENPMETGSYISDHNKDKHNFIDAQVCVMALIREEFDSYVARCNSLILNSLCGKNIYYRV